jgi:hypothetical protein
VVPTFNPPVLVDPDTQEHALTPDEQRKGREFAAKWFPALANQPLVDSRICQREDSIDEHFIVQAHPELGQCVGGRWRIRPRLQARDHDRRLRRQEGVSARMISPKLAATFAAQVRHLLIHTEQRLPGTRPYGSAVGVPCLHSVA